MVPLHRKRAVAAAVFLPAWLRSWVACPASSLGGRAWAPAAPKRAAVEGGIAGGRKEFLHSIAGLGLAAAYDVHAANAELIGTGGGLRAKLAKKDAKELTAPLFNIPPGEQIFPEWLEGTWDVNQTFTGAVFPTLPKETALGEVDLPGFKTCSVLDFADVGKESAKYSARWVRKEKGVVEDQAYKMQSSIIGHLGGKAEVTRVVYEPGSDPNRLTAYLTGTRNAERVELFVNARDSERAQDNPDLFFASEYRRQVTFSSRVLQGYSGNYQHYRTFKRLDDTHVRLSVLTAAYVDPLSPLYFQAVDKPVVVFAHSSLLTRRPRE